MRVFVTTVLIWIVAASRLAYADVITAITFDVSSSQTVITVADTGQAKPNVFALGGDTPRIVMDWDSTRIGFDTGGLSELKGYGHVRTVRYAQRGETGLRIVLDLAPGADLEAYNYHAGALTVNVNGNALSGVKPASTLEQTRMFGSQIPYPQLKPRQTAKAIKPRRPIIVIDPGHGGRDPGAIGAKGTHEKTITLAASLELKRQLMLTGRYDVILTRGNDRYIEHEERIRIARARQGDLFISVHADSAESRTVRGASVYTLSNTSKTRSKSIVNSQNWIMDVDLTEQSDPVGDILVDLAQRKTVTQSEFFADLLVSKLSGKTRLVGNTHRRAGYFVLLAPDVPAVLLELGFISNANDEALLKSSAHRQKLMGSVVTAINAYFDHQKS